MMKRVLWTVMCLSIFLVGQLSAGLIYTYVGSFRVDSGPSWPSVPLAYTGQEAAALLFGGIPADYAISTNSNTVDPLTITFTAWYSTWGGACGVTFPCGTEYAQDYSNNTGGLYQTYGDVSAYVNDWAAGAEYTNYVWSASGVPEPGTWGLMALALAAGAVSLRRRRP